MYFREETITPEIAAEYLKHNESNRSLRQSDVEKYARDMANGAWELTPEVIAIGENGNLKNGQHRLNAVIKAGIPVNFIVAYDVPDSVTIFDRGVLRTSSDVLRMNGVSVSASTTMADALYNFLFLLCGVKKVTDMTKIEFIAEHEDDVVNALGIANIISSKEKLCRPAPIATAIYCAIRCGISETALRRFVMTVNSGFPENSEEFAAVVLRNYMKQTYTGSDPDRRFAFAVATNAIRDFSSRQPRKQIYRKDTKPAFFDYVRKTDLDKYVKQYHTKK